MNIVEKTTDENPTAKHTLEPPQRLEVGSIVTLRMRGHSRTNGLEYFAPAVVLKQHEPNGEIEVLIWDSTSGSAYANAYPIRDIGVRGDGNERQMYVIQDNIGVVLFSPDQFADMSMFIEAMDLRLCKLENARDQEHNAKVPGLAPPLAQPVMAKSSELKDAAKPQPART